jgi:hypothetical protein
LQFRIFLFSKLIKTGTAGRIRKISFPKGNFSDSAELKRAGIPFHREKVYELFYLGENVGTYHADIVVDDKIILEIKSVLGFHPVMEAQIINYLKVSKIPVGYLSTFGGPRWSGCGM